MNVCYVNYGIALCICKNNFTYVKFQYSFGLLFLFSATATSVSQFRRKVKRVNETLSTKISELMYIASVPREYCTFAYMKASNSYNLPKLING